MASRSQPLPSDDSFAAVRPLSNRTKKSHQQPSLLACIPCRSKHLKCDAQLPICGRCTKSRQQCFYRESQRGHRRGTRNGTDKSVEQELGGTRGSSSSSPQATGNHPTRAEGSFPDSANNALTCLPSTPPDDNSIDLGVYDFDFNNLASMMSMTQSTDSQPPDGHSPAGHMIREFNGSSRYPPLMTSDELFALPQHLPTMQSENGSNNNGAEAQGTFSNPMVPPHMSMKFPASEPGPQPDHLVDAFYSFFHPAHPFIVPQLIYARNPSSVRSCLKAAMQFTGSHFLPGSSKIETLRHNALVIEIPSAPDDGTKVQAMLLVAMTLFARFEQSDARSLMGQAIDLALGLKMYLGDYSLQAGHGDPTLEESWRRTWWELYTVSCLLTALNGPAAIWPLRDVQSDVPLPSEEESYRLCQPVTLSKTAQEMQIREFLTEEAVFSSFGYQVEATRLLGKVLRLASDTCCARDSAVEAMDGELSNFLLSLPPEKREIIESDGIVDEVLFNAHMIINWALILLHRPLSWLSWGLHHYETACTLNTGAGEQGSGEMGDSIPLFDAQAVHTSKAISAASQMLKAATVRTTWKRHTPCFTCAAATAAVVLLPAYAVEKDVQMSQVLQGRLQLTINSLARTGEVWPLARVVKIQVTEFATKILVARGNLSQPAVSSSVSNRGPTRNVPNVVMDLASPHHNTLAHRVNDAIPTQIPS
jgi:Fungal Zn(2)-Cys(6) binuclear cluster domain/Fungal specific transcription factor domain